MRVLVDSSVWVDHLRGVRTRETRLLGSLLDALDPWAAPQSQVTLVLSDLVMPRMGGVELAEVLRHRAPACRLLFMSAYDERLRARTRAGDREVPVVAKPFAAYELLWAVRRALD